MKKSLIFALAALLTASLACSLGEFLPNTGGTGGSQPSNVLFKDDFSSSSSGWDQFNDTDGVSDYTNGAYRIYVNKVKYSYWANPGLGASLPGDLHIEVDATKTAGPDMNDYGILCRYKDKDNFYYLVIGSDGYASIVAIINGEQKSLAEVDKDDAIKTGGAANRIGAECIGSKLTLYANGEQILSASDSNLASGDVGLVAGTYDEAGADILFDNFVVTRP